MRHLAPILALSSLMTLACTPSTSLNTREDTLVLQVAPDSVECVGEMRGRCLQVRGQGETVWRTFYESIDGFQHESGFLYTLEVGRRTVPNPPADGSGYAYRLIRILAKDPVGGEDP